MLMFHESNLERHGLQMGLFKSKERFLTDALIKERALNEALLQKLAAPPRLLNLRQVLAGLPFKRSKFYVLMRKKLMLKEKIKKI